MNRSFGSLFATAAILSTAGCAAPASTEGVETSSALVATASPLESCSEGQTAIDFSVVFTDGTEDKAHGCFPDGDDWFVNDRMLNVDAALPGGELSMRLRILHRDALTGAGLVFPGPAGDANVSYSTSDHYYSARLARVEVSAVALPQVESVPDGVLAGTLTAHIESNIGDRGGELRVTFATHGIKLGFI